MNTWLNTFHIWIIKVCVLDMSSVAYNARRCRFQDVLKQKLILHMLYCSRIWHRALEMCDAQNVERWRTKKVPHIVRSRHQTAHMSHEEQRSNTLRTCTHTQTGTWPPCWWWTTCIKSCGGVCNMEKGSERSELSSRSHSRVWCNSF